MRDQDSTAVRVWSRRLHLGTRLAQIVTLALFVLVWELISRGRSLFLAEPWATLHDAAQWVTDGTLRHDVGITLVETCAGVLVAVAAGFLAAAIAVSLPLVMRFIQPFIAAGNALPKLVLTPLFVLLFGIGLTAKIYFIGIVLWFIPFYLLVAAVQGIDAGIVAHTRVIGGSRWNVYREVYLPQLSGAAIMSLRLTIGWAFGAAVISEFIASTGGVGYVMNSAEQQLQPNVVAGALVVIGVISFLFDRALLRFERRLVRWRTA